MAFDGRWMIWCQTVRWVCLHTSAAAMRFTTSGGSLRIRLEPDGSLSSVMKGTRRRVFLRCCCCCCCVT